MSGRRALVLAAMVCGVVSLAAPPGAGGPPLQVVSDPAVPAVATVILEGVATVILQSVPVLRLRGPDAESRAAEVARRLTDILAAAAPPFTVSVASRGKSADLLLNGRHLVTVDAAQAQANRTTPLELAHAWADRLRQALARNTVTLTPSVLALRPGERATVAVSAFLPGPVTIGPHDERVVVARLAAGGVSVEARAIGSVTVPVSVGGGVAALAVIVRRPAGAIPDTLAVRVTGDLGSPAVVREAVQRRIEQAVLMEPGTSLTLGPIHIDEAGLAADPPIFAVPVSLRSPYALPVEGVIRVTVVRESVDVVDPALLLVSNRPEAVLADGVLFEEVVDARRPTRLLYHHQNGTPDRSRVLTIALTNRADRPAELLLISGLAGPSPDTLFVGSASTARFLQNLVAGRGYILELPPRSTYAFTAQTMAPLQLVSGLLQFQLLAGEHLEVRIATRLPWLLDRTVAIPVNQIAYPHPKGIFAAPTVEVARTVDVLQTTTLIDLGVAAALRDLRTDEPLVGDYGVVYRLTISAANPFPHDLRANLVATAAGGAARGVFLIDGRLVEMAIYRGFEERTLATLTVPAGQRITTLIVTMPTAGSYYPVRLSLRPQP
ncbi:MAG: hypothetical protein ACRDF5_02435 [bacterium]